MEIVLATSNEHKVKEINAIAQNYNIKFILPPSNFDPLENGTTFEVLMPCEDIEKQTGKQFKE